MSLIDRHDLLKKVYEHPQERERMTDGEWCRKCIYEAPTIEAEPVRRGRWIEDKPMTNGDRIRAMTDEELADFFCQISQCCINDAGCSMCPIYDGCAQNVMCVETWLKQEVKTDDER